MTKTGIVALDDGRHRSDAGVGRLGVSAAGNNGDLKP
jgi:hypothetical protein